MRNQWKEVPEYLYAEAVRDYRMGKAAYKLAIHLGIPWPRLRERLISEGIWRGKPDYTLDRDHRCLHCNEPIAHRTGEATSMWKSRKYCNRDCYVEHNKRDASDESRESKICLTCGKTIQRRPDESPSLWERRRVCSKQCAGTFNTRNRKPTPMVMAKLVCAGCGVEFERQKAIVKTTIVYCSNRCHRIVERTIPDVVCETCGKIYRPDSGDRRRFCSRECWLVVHRIKPRVCVICGKSFKIKGNRHQPTCSRACGRLNAGHGPTPIECETYAALHRMGIAFERQRFIYPYCVDAYIPATRTIIECQGDYWHVNPAVYPNGPVNEPQRAWVKRDAQRKSHLINKGYVVIELWEKDINEHGAEALLRTALGDKLAA